MGRFIINDRMRQIYNEERNKLSSLPNADDDDFTALDRAWERYFSEKKVDKEEE